MCGCEDRHLIGKIVPGPGELQTSERYSATIYYAERARMKVVVL